MAVLTAVMTTTMVTEGGNGSGGDDLIEVATVDGEGELGAR